MIAEAGLPTIDELPATGPIRPPLTKLGVLRYATGRVIVKFRDGAPSESQIASLRASSSRTGSLSARPASADFDVVTFDPDVDPETVAAALRGQPDVEYAQAAYVNHSLMVPNDPLYKTLQWNFPLIDLERAWDIQPRAGFDITVAVLDTGMAYTNATVKAHVIAFKDDQGNIYPSLGNVTIPYLAASQLVTPGRIVSPHDFIWGTDTPIDFDGHGTHVSGTIGQLTNDGIGTAGVAFNVKLMPVKVVCSDWDYLFSTPGDVCGTDDQVAQGIRYAADNGANIINMSIGRDGPPNCGTIPNQEGCSPVVEAAIRYAVSKRVFIAIAAGNSFLDGNPTQMIAEIASRVEGPYPWRPLAPRPATPFTRAPEGSSNWRRLADAREAPVRTMCTSRHSTQGSLIHTHCRWRSTGRPGSTFWRIWGIAVHRWPPLTSQVSPRC